MINAVAVQMMMVSTKTPSDWINPCLTGCDTVAVAATLGALPMPASLENRPRLTPLSIAAAIPPVKPPAICCIPNAPPMISAKACGRLVILSPMMMSASST